MSGKVKGLAAIESAIRDVAMRNVTPRDTLVHATRSEQTNPTSAADRLSALDRQILAEIMREPLRAKQPQRGRDTIGGNKTPCDAVRQVSLVDQTKPNA